MQCSDRFILLWLLLLLLLPLTRARVCSRNNNRMATVNGLNATIRRNRNKTEKQVSNYLILFLSDIAARISFLSHIKFVTAIHFLVVIAVTAQIIFVSLFDRNQSSNNYQQSFQSPWFDSMANWVAHVEVIIEIFFSSSFSCWCHR